MQNIINAATRKELKKELTFVTYNEIDNVSSYKTERGAVNHLKKLNEERAAKFNGPKCKEIFICVSWSREGHPTATASAEMTDGTRRNIKAHAGGWGYCKISTVLANILNKAAAANIYEFRSKAASAPYGLNYRTDRKKDRIYDAYFAGGVGEISTLCGIEFLGGSCSHRRHRKNFETYTIEF